MISSYRKRLLLAAAFVVAGIFLVFVTSRLINNKNDEAPASSFVPSNAPATITNSEELFAELEASQFAQLRDDLTNYSRNYKKSESESITYDFEGFISKNDEELVFTVVSSNKPDHSIEVKLTKLQQQRIRLSFIDKKSGSSEFDSSLKSNSKRNSFISTLPYSDRLFTVEYNQGTNKFVLLLYERSDAVKQQAMKIVNDGVSPTAITDSDFEILAPGLFEDAPLETEPIEGD